MVFANQPEIQLRPVGELGDQRLPVDGRALALFSSVPLDGGGRSADWPEAAVIVIHGALRNARDYYEAVRSAAGLAGLAGRRHAVIAPQFLADPDLADDPSRAELLHWGPEDWKGGLGPTSSFLVMDRLLHFVETRTAVRRVTIVGNSAGGQFVNRYAAVGKAPAEVRFPVRFVVANPSTYLYFDEYRPVGDAFVPHHDPAVDHWRYGFSGTLPRYVDQSPKRYFEQYSGRNVTYLLGGKDNDPEAVLLEVHPAANAQGRTRLERGRNYFRYLRHKAGRDVHELRIEETAGHDADALFASAAGLDCLFS